MLLRALAPIRRGRCPPQSPAPGFGEKYWSLSGFPSHSLESGGGAFLTVIFGQILAYSAFSDSHFSSPGSLSALMECIPALTLLCHFIDAIKAGDFARAE